MSLDVMLVCNGCNNELYTSNITHNLGSMAEAAGLYGALWRPEETGRETAADLVGPLTEGLTRLLASPEDMKALNPANGWGSYEGLVRFVQDDLAACLVHPAATIEVSR